MENEIWQVLKTVRTDKTPRINGFPYEMYLKLSHIFPPHLISPEQCCAVKIWIIQASLYLVHMIKEKVNGNATLINLNQSKAFDRVDHVCLAVLSGAWFGLYFHCWIHLVCIPLSHSGGERSRIKILHFVLINSSKLSTLTYAVNSYIEAFEGEPSLTLPDANTTARNSAYADDINVLVMWSGEVKKVRKKLEGVKAYQGTKLTIKSQ